MLTHDFTCITVYTGGELFGDSLESFQVISLTLTAEWVRWCPPVRKEEVGVSIRRFGGVQPPELRRRIERAITPAQPAKTHKKIKIKINKQSELGA